MSTLKDYQREQVELWQKNNDQKALKLLIDSVENLIKKQVKSVLSWSNVSYDDLFAEGVLGVIEAANDFNLDRDTKFSGSAFFHIKYRILRYANKSRSLTKITETHTNRSIKQRGLSLYSKYIGAGMSREEALQKVSDEIGNTTPQNVESIIQSVSNTSLDALDDWGDMFGCENEDINRFEVEKSTNVLTPIYEDVLSKMTYGHRYVFEQRNLVDGAPVPYNKIAKHLGVTMQLAKQCNKEALENIRVKVIRLGYSLDDFL